MIADGFNGILESISAILIFTSIIRLYGDKMVRGITIYHAGFFLLWGIWNLYYYPSLDQWASFAGSILIVLTNGIWVGMMAYYNYKEYGKVY